jgi:hypothetical protein
VNNSVIMDMLSREQKRRNQEEIRQIQLLNAVGYQPLGFFHLLRSWISRLSIRRIDKTTTGDESFRIRQPHHG